MRKLIIILSFFIIAKAKGQYVLTQDTTVNGTWSLETTILKINSGVKISGTGTISGGYIDASYYQDIFDTTLNVNIKGGAYGKVSTSWFGASPSNANNTRYFQKSIDACINKNTILYTPAGTYVDSSNLLIAQYYSGNYQSVSLKWEGDYVFNGAVAGTVIRYKNGGNFCLGIQKGKGVELKGLSFVGNFVPPTGGGGEGYYNQTWDNFLDTNCTAYLSGIVVDPYVPPSGSSGSTGILFSNLSVSGFTTLFNISPNSGAVLNAEEIIAERINFGSGRTGWLNGQPQEKQNVIRNSMAWGGLHTFFKNYYQSGNYHIHDINVAGSVIRLFDINQAGWFSTKIDHIFAESIATIGNLTTTAMGISISDCIFAFAYKSEAGNQYLLNSNSLNVRFRSCDFTYFGQTYSMAFSGTAAYDGCTFSGAYTNQSTGSTFTSNCQFLN